MIKIYSQLKRGEKWLVQYQECRPVFACILGFTATGLLPGISTAGATPADRQYTAIADAEFLNKGVCPHPRHPLPPLAVGASPAFISRAVIEALPIRTYLFNAGLPQPPAVPAIDLGGLPANCLTSGQALPLTTVRHLFRQGIAWGETLAREAAGSYLLVGECVVGGTTTALALLTGLGIEAAGKVNSSHPRCNHQQKWAVVQAGLQAAAFFPPLTTVDPFALVAAVGDPMQVAAAGMAIAASRSVGVLLAGGTQMLAVSALIQALCHQSGETANLERIAVGTTRWVAEDPTGDTIGLAESVGKLPLLAAQLCFAAAQSPQLQAYEAGYVKEGVGAGGCAIAAHLAGGWTNLKLLAATESLLRRYCQIRSSFLNH